ncbi:MAG: hypothetical protein JRF38_23655 [Deltaproteobacteria bacterium]|jgi:hypothetical protein|nr:hypothetical protein [Deltaproteobacteria bacterium]
MIYFKSGGFWLAASENLIRIAKSIPKSAITHNLLDNRRLDKIDGRCRASLKNAVHFCGHPICFFVNETIRPAAISGSEFTGRFHKILKYCRNKN